MIEEPLVPIYMYHRYAVEATASMIGGQDFVYAMRGDNRTPVEWVNGEMQRKATRCAGADAEAVRADDSASAFSICCRRGRPATACTASCSRGPPARDSIRSTPASIAADVTIGFILQPDRAARMVAQNAVDQSLPGLGEVIDRLIRATFDQPITGSYEAEVRRAEERVLVDRVMWLAAVAPNAQVRAIATLKLNRLARPCRRRASGDGDPR